jgi:hypothetical protein
MKTRKQKIKQAQKEARERVNQSRKNWGVTHRTNPTDYGNGNGGYWRGLVTQLHQDLITRMGLKWFCLALADTAINLDDTWFEISHEDKG